MKKTVIAFGILLSTFSFAKEAKITKEAKIKRSVAADYNTVLTSGTYQSGGRSCAENVVQSKDRIVLENQSKTDGSAISCGFMGHVTEFQKVDDDRPNTYYKMISAPHQTWGMSKTMEISPLSTTAFILDALGEDGIRYSTLFTLKCDCSCK